MSIDPSIKVPQREIAEFRRRWNVVELALFGSAARGELHPDSDIDVMAAFAPEARHTLFDLGGAT